MDIAGVCQAIIECMNDPVYVRDLDMNILYINPAAENLTGYKLKEAMGKKCHEVFGDTQSKCIKNCPVERAINEKLCIQEQEGELKARSGKIRIIRKSISPLHHDGKLSGAVVLMQDITGQKHAEIRLHEQERLTAKITETSPAIIYVYDMADRKNVYTNTGIEQILGYKANDVQIMGADLFPLLIHPDDLNTVMDFQKKFKAVADGQILEVEYRTKHANGQWRMLRSYEQPFLRNPDGSLKQKIGVAIDVTEHKQAEATLMREKSFSGAVLDSLHGIFYVFSDQGRFLRWNRALEQVSGFSRDEIATMNPRDFFDNEEKTVIEKAIQAVFEKGRAIVEASLVSKDGRKTPFLFTGKRFSDHKSQMIVGMGLDISEQKRVEHALQERESRYRTIFQSGSQGFYIMTEVFLECNEQACRIWACAPEEIIGHTPLDFSPPIQPDGRKSEDAANAYISAARAGIPQRFYWQHRRKDGRLIDCEITLDALEINGETLLLAAVTDISERKLAETKLEESENRYRTFFEQSPAAVLVIDPETRKAVDFNDRTISLLGCSRETFAQLQINDYEAVENPEHTGKHIKEILATGGDLFETMVRTIDGRIRDIEVSARVIEIGGKKFLHSILRDITDAKQIQTLTRAERDMAAAWTRAGSFEARLATCLETAVRTASMDSGGIYLMDEANGSLTLAVNQGLSEAFINHVRNYNADSFNTRMVMQRAPIYDYINDLSPLDQKKIYQEGLKVIAIVPLHFEGRVLGCLNIASHTKERVPDYARFALERIASYVGAFIAREIEVDKRHQIQRNLVSLFNTIEDMFFILDMNGNIVRCNKNVSDRLGYAEDELIGKHVLFVHPENRHQEAQAVIRDMMAGRTDMCQVPLQTKSGRIIPVETKVVLGRWQDQDVIFGVSRDITDRLEMDRRNQQVEKAKSLSRMAGAVAHRFNNMLAAVIGNLEIAREELPAGTGILEYINEAEHAAHRAAETSGLMLTFLGQSRGNPVLSDLSEICRKFVPKWRAQIPELISFETVLPVPGPFVNVDQAQMEQILDILVTNAREAIGDKSGRVRIAAAAATSEDFGTGRFFPVEWRKTSDAYTCLTVMDTGHGMDEKTIDQIFDPFFTNKFTGRGLGLAVALGIIKSMNGCIAVTSRPGHGSRFCIFLPQSSDAVRSLKDEKIIDTEQIPGGGKILLAEDQEIVREMTTAMLKRMGFDVLVAKDGADAAEIFRKRHNEIRLVFSDLTMPRMNGWELLEVIRHLRPDIPVILLSGYDEAQAMAGDHPERPQIFLHKPYRLETLKAAIDQALGGKMKS